VLVTVEVDPEAGVLVAVDVHPAEDGAFTANEAEELDPDAE
jgi:hypothetical protein